MSTHVAAGPQKSQKSQQAASARDVMHLAITCMLITHCVASAMCACPYPKLLVTPCCLATQYISQHHFGVSAREFPQHCCLVDCVCVHKVAAASCSAACRPGLL